MTNTFSDDHLATLRTTYATLDTVSIDRLNDFRAIFNGCSDDAIAQLTTANIKFVSKLAVNEMTRRGLATPAALKTGIYKSANGRPFVVR